MGETQRIAIDLSPEALDALRTRVERGEYPTEGAVVEAAVRLLDGDDLSRRLQQLRQRVHHSLSDGKEPLTSDEAERHMAVFMQQPAKPAR